MPGVSFMNGDNIGRVIIEGGEPLFLLLGCPLALRRGDVIVRFGRAFLEGVRRVGGGERGGAAILRRFFDADPDFGWNRDQRQRGPGVLVQELSKAALCEKI